MSTQVRLAAAEDEAAIAAIHLAAFSPQEGPEIAALVADLQRDPTAQPLLSRLATAEGGPVGHVLFSKVSLQPEQPLAASLLAPLAVHPDWQRQDLGSQLIRTGLQRLQARGVALVFVLGNPHYYGRYGFAAASCQDFAAPHPLPPAYAEAWMVQELQPGALARASGQVVCADALSDPRYWCE